MKPYYQDDAVTIYHGDCREIVQKLGIFDCMITDPPFSQYTHTNAKSNRDKGYGNAAIDFAAIDFAAIDFAAIDDLLRFAGEKIHGWIIANMDWRHIAEIERRKDVRGWELVRFGVWVKTNPMPQISSDRPANGWDGIAYLRKIGHKKQWNGGGHHGNWIGPVITNGDHPTGKPIQMIMQWVERFTQPTQTILDPFAGSGTTGRAAKDLGRKCTLIEREEKYCEIAAKRMAQEVLAFDTGLVKN
jgi:site-specific DNA-methyltransferase (adenine-specific)